MKSCEKTAEWRKRYGIYIFWLINIIQRITGSADIYNDCGIRNGLIMRYCTCRTHFSGRRSPWTFSSTATILTTVRRASCWTAATNCAVIASSCRKSGMVSKAVWNLRRLSAKLSPTVRRTMS